MEVTIPESVLEFDRFSVGFMEIRKNTSPEKIVYRMKGKCIAPGFHIKGVNGSDTQKYAE